jgi:hypothetical protein
MAKKYAFRLLAFMILVVACAGCATTRMGSNEVVVTDSTTRREIQRLVSVSVPADSARLRTKIQFDEKTGKFRPVTVFSRAGHTGLNFLLDANGNVSVYSLATAYTAQVPVTDTQVQRTISSKQREVQLVKAPLSRFVKFCIGFTIVLTLLFILWLCLKLSPPFSFLTRISVWLKFFTRWKS